MPVRDQLTTSPKQSTASNGARQRGRTETILNTCGQVLFSVRLLRVFYIRFLPHLSLSSSRFFLLFFRFAIQFVCLFFSSSLLARPTWPFHIVRSTSPPQSRKKREGVTGKVRPICTIPESDLDLVSSIPRMALEGKVGTCTLLFSYIPQFPSNLNITAIPVFSHPPPSPFFRLPQSCRLLIVGRLPLYTTHSPIIRNDILKHLRCTVPRPNSHFSRRSSFVLPSSSLFTSPCSHRADQYGRLHSQLPMHLACFAKYRDAHMRTKPPTELSDRPLVRRSWTALNRHPPFYNRLYESRTLPS